jgi:hypothetical protein
MIAWSNNQLKFTSGIGALGTVALLADTSTQALPPWLAVGLAMLPILIFLFVQPGETRDSIVLPLQVLASLWYLSLAVILSYLFFNLDEKPKGWPVYFICLAIGSIPSIVVLKRCSRPQQAP